MQMNFTFICGLAVLLIILFFPRIVDAWKGPKIKKDILKEAGDATFMELGQLYNFENPDKNKILMAKWTQFSWGDRSKIGGLAFYARLAKKYMQLPTSLVLRGFAITKFPDPLLRNLHPKLEQNCSNDPIRCMNSAFHVLKSSYWFTSTFFGIPEVSLDTLDLKSWAKIDQDLFDTYGRIPFEEAEEFRQFVITLSYFFCWYTMLELEIFKILPYCSLTDSWFSLYAGWPVLRVEDFDNEPFRCARFSFCPDPCCHRTERNQTNCDEDEQNPCRDLLHKKCATNAKMNDDFASLAQNQFNRSCRCNHHGFVYREMIKGCMDNDECASPTMQQQVRTVGCNKLDVNTICVNTIGHYKCVCRHGYELRRNGTTCIKSPLFSNLVRSHSIIKFCPRFNIAMIIVILLLFVY